MTHFPKINPIHNTSLRLQYVCVYVIVSVLSCSNKDLRKKTYSLFSAWQSYKDVKLIPPRAMLFAPIFSSDMTSAALSLALSWLGLWPSSARFIVL